MLGMVTTYVCVPEVVLFIRAGHVCSQYYLPNILFNYIIAPHHKKERQNDPDGNVCNIERG